jgi:mono/diheme cytochrome c family protein
MRVALLRSSVVLSLLTASCGSDPNQPGPDTFFPPFGPGATTTTSTGGGGPFGTYDQPVVVPVRATPALSGGTLLLTAQGHKAAVADPERDHVVFVDLDQLLVTSTVALQKGDEPGRLVEGTQGRVHVVLRGAGAVATLDPAAGTEIARQAVCANPRGLAYDAAADTIHVACAGGELVTVRSAGGDPVRQLKLERDLRDVVIDGPRLLVSRFRAAELLVVEPDGRVSQKLVPAGLARDPNIPTNAPPGTPGAAAFSPAVAWRTIPAPGGGAIMTFQEEQTSPVQIEPGGYGGFCGGIVRGGASLLRVDGSGWTATNTGAVLPVDVAASVDGSQITIASAGSVDTAGFRTTPPIANLTTPPPPVETSGSCGPTIIPNVPTPDGQVVAVAFDASRRIIMQTRDPMLIVGDRALVLPGEIIRDTGHELFHMGTQGGLACASCHPEGHDDGHVWTFASIGVRRTQSLAGGTLGTGPFHWSGDMKDLLMLSSEVLSKRMSGPTLKGEHVQALAAWIDKVPGYKPGALSDAAAVDRGRTLFNDASVGCASCHTGAAMTNHALVDVGTGAPFKVPSLLGVAYRAPFMHNGCAATLGDRFGACGGSADKHGHVSTLTDAQRVDLVEYLGSL